MKTLPFSSRKLGVISVMYGMLSHSIGQNATCCLRCTGGNCGKCRKEARRGGAPLAKPLTESHRRAYSCGPPPQCPLVRPQAAWRIVTQ